MTSDGGEKEVRQDSHAEDPALLPSRTDRRYLLPVAVAASGLSLAAAPELDGAFAAALACVMLWIAAIDYRRQIIPDVLTGASALLALARLIAQTDGGEDLRNALTDAVVRAFVCVLVFLALRLSYRWFCGREGLGLGDVKLAAIAALWLDWRGLTLALDLSAFSALAAYLVWPRLRGRSIGWGERLPFGTFLAPSIWLAWLIAALAG